MPLRGCNFVGGARSTEGERTFQVVNPATGEKCQTVFHEATQDEIDRALALADEAFRAKRPADPTRTVSLLRAIADGIEALGDELVEVACAETGLPPGRIKMERGRTCGQLRLFADVVAEGSWVDARIDRAAPRRRPVRKPDVRRMLAPIGPVAVFPASNFPLAFSVAGGDTASALAAGCPVIVKARPVHAGTSELVAGAVVAAVADAGFPPGWFAMLHGPGRSTGIYLTKHPVVRAVGFTGSESGGRALFDAAASRPDPIPVYAEMGSVNPVFLLPEALAARADELATKMHQSLTLGVGQFCTNPGLVVAIEGEPLERFVAALGRLVEQTPPGVMLFDAIRQSYDDAVRRRAGTTGVRQVAQSAEAADPGQTQCVATVFRTGAAEFLADDSLHGEIFGPATLVVGCRDRTEMLRVAESLQGQLTATVHAEDPELTSSRDLVAILERKAGRLVFGGFPTGVEVCAAMNHGGPYPATTDVRTTSVGTAAIERFARPVCYQDCPEACLPEELRNKNTRGIWRLIDNVLTTDDVA